MTVIDAVTLVALGDTFPVSAREGVRATLEGRRLIGWIVHTRLLIRFQLHSVWTATHSLGVRRWETEMTAVSIWVCLPAAEVRSCWE